MFLKYKKQSGVSSKSQHKSLILYLDRNLGSKIVPSILKNAGIECEIHDDHLPQDAEDQKWVKLCSDNNWIAITKDSQIRYNPPIKAFIASSKAGIIILSAVNQTGSQLGQLILDSFNRIERFCLKINRPFIARLNKSGIISQVEM